MLSDFIKNICKFAQVKTLEQPPVQKKPTVQPQKPIPAPVEAPKPNPLEEFGRSSEMNFLLSPTGQEYPVPGMTHSGEAAKIVKQLENADMDPSLALDYLLKKGWIRVSGEVFEMWNFARAKEAIKSFLTRHNDYYQHVNQLEIDNRAKGFSKYVPTTNLYNPSFDVESPAASRADEMRRLRNQWSSSNEAIIEAQTWQKTDWEKPVDEVSIKKQNDVYHVFNKDGESVLAFKDIADAQTFAKEYQIASLSRKGTGKTWEKWLPKSINSIYHSNQPSNIIPLNSKFEQEQQIRDEILAPYTFEERREKFKEKRNKGEPFVPEVKDLFEKIRIDPSYKEPNKEPDMSVPDVPSVEEIKKKYKPKPRLIAWVHSILKSS